MHQRAFENIQRGDMKEMLTKKRKWVDEWRVIGNRMNSTDVDED